MWRIVLALLLLAAGGASQTGSRTVSGRVLDKRGNTLPGAVVQLENTVTLSIESYIARDGGRYFFKGLNPDVEFTLYARYRNYISKTATLSKFNTSKEPTIDLVIPIE
jgi:hypothetical protein